MFIKINTSVIAVTSARVAPLKVACTIAIAESSNAAVKSLSFGRIAKRRLQRGPGVDHRIDLGAGRAEGRKLRTTGAIQRPRANSRRCLI